MKIIMRHGKCTPCTILANGNVSHLILPKEFKDLVEKGKIIRSRFSTLPTIYTSHTDRAIETALLISSPDGEEVVRLARKKIDDELVKLEILNKSGNWYERFDIMIPPHISTDKCLYDEVPANIMAEDNIVVITHSDAIEQLHLKLSPGEYAELP